MMKRILFLLLSYAGYTHATPPVVYDICVYGGTSGGVIAAYTAKMLGKSVLLIEPGKHLGGLSSGGLGFTDIGNKYAVTGLALDFYRRTGSYYGTLESWIFEPHVAEDIFLQYISMANVPVRYNNRLVSVKKEQGFIQNITVEQGGKRSVISAKMFIDCSYEGDLMAKAGVPYMVGREANSVYGETFNGVQVHGGNQVPGGVDPFKIPGDPESGLLWGISNAPLLPAGSGDKKVQAYNFRICLTNDPANRIPITKPERYDPVKYELLLRIIAKLPNATLRHLIKIDRMPNSKTDINNNGGFSTDMPGMNWDYPDGDDATRQKIRQMHEDYNKGLLYFMGNDPRVPAGIRKDMLEWGYPKDEYKNNGHWSPQLYIREARRMIGEYVMTQANCDGKEKVQDGIAMAAYGMDSHNTERLVINGKVRNEGDVQKGVAAVYPVSYRAIIPKAADCKNLLVPVCISASHIAYGSIRMEPVFMVMGQSAATAAVVALEDNKTVQEVNVRKVQLLLKENPLADGRTADVLIDNEDTQRVALTGEWQLQKGNCFGPAAYVTGSKDATIKFLPEIKEKRYYRVYTYISSGIKEAAEETFINIHDGDSSHQVSVKRSALRVHGQTSGEWVLLGKFLFREGTNGYVQFNNRSENALMVADAVLLVPAYEPGK